MPRGYRRVVFAVVGWLILTGQHPNNASQTEEAKAQTRIADSLANISRAYDDQAERAESAPEGKPCEPGQEQRDSDLCAQWKAADAAEEAAGWAAVSGILSIAGLVGVAGALFLTVKSNRIASDSAKKQLRAYLTVSPGGVNEPDERGLHRVPVLIKNWGQTPAHSVMLYGNFAITSSPQDFDPAGKTDLLSTPATDRILGPGEQHYTFAYASASFLEDHWAGISTKHKALIHFGYVTYDDVFGVTQQSNFAFYHHGPELSDLTALRCRLGNHAT